VLWTILHNTSFDHVHIVHPLSILSIDIFIYFRDTFFFFAFKLEFFVLKFNSFISAFIFYSVLCLFHDPSFNLDACRGTWSSVASVCVSMSVSPKVVSLLSRRCFSRCNILCFSRCCSWYLTVQSMCHIVLVLVFVDAPIAVSLCVVVNILAVSVGVSVDG